MEEGNEVRGGTGGSSLSPPGVSEQENSATPAPQLEKIWTDGIRIPV